MHHRLFHFAQSIRRSAVFYFLHRGLSRRREARLEGEWLGVGPYACWACVGLGRGVVRTKMFRKQPKKLKVSSEVDLHAVHYVFIFLSCGLTHLAALALQTSGTCQI